VACKVVCISHATGAGGEEVGRLVAERLGFRYVDDEVVAGAAARGGIQPRDVADEERRKSFVARFLDAWAQSGGEAWALTGSGSLLAGDELGSDDVRALIRETVGQMAARGNVVIVAHAASHAVERGPTALRVLVTASPETRAGRLGGGDAARSVKEADAARRDYLKRFYDVDEESPTHYDLVVNTDVLSIEQAARLVSEAGSS
jgi:cytidylate kinase